MQRRLGCPVIEVSELSIEEISHRIIRLVERRKAEAGLKPKPPVPMWRWATWFSIMGVAVVVFYVLLTPIWLGLRGLAWRGGVPSRRP